MKTRTFFCFILFWAFLSASWFGAAQSPPTITTQPVSQTVRQGTNVTFTVGESGASPLTNQWTFGGVAIAGATGTNFTINSAQPTNAGSYLVVVSNGLGRANSAPAILTVLVPPSITNQPASQSVAQGGNVTFTVGESGTPPLMNQWMFNGANLSGATNISLTISNAQQSDEGSYVVTVANLAGSTNSAPATLTVAVTNRCALSLASDPGGVVSGFDSATLPPGNDNPSTNVATCFPFCFCGTTYTNLWVNNDGNVTLDGPFGGHLPDARGISSFEPRFQLRDLGRVILAPFWADIDTTTNSGSGTVKWGCNCVTVNLGVVRPAFGVTWNSVGYFPDIGERSDKTNSFQMLIIDRSDRLGGGFDLQYRYGSIQWDTASSCHGTKGLCVPLPTGDPGGFPARVGYASGTNCGRELPGSGICDQSLRDGRLNALVNGSHGSRTNGVYTWQFFLTNCPTGSGL